MMMMMAVVSCDLLRVQHNRRISRRDISPKTSRRPLRCNGNRSSSRCHQDGRTFQEDAQRRFTTIERPHWWCSCAQPRRGEGFRSSAWSQQQQQQLVGGLWNGSSVFLSLSVEATQRVWPVIIRPSLPSTVHWCHLPPRCASDLRVVRSQAGGQEAKWHDGDGRQKYMNGQPKQQMNVSSWNNNNYYCYGNNNSSSSSKRASRCSRPQDWVEAVSLHQGERGEMCSIRVFNW